LLKQKVAQKVTIILGYFIHSKYHIEPPKVVGENLDEFFQVFSLYIS